MKRYYYDIPLALVLFLISCSNGEKDDFRQLIDDANDNYISSEKLDYKVDTLATGLDNPWGLTFLPNGDLLVTERDGEIRIMRDGKLLEQKISGVPEVFSKGQGGLFEIKLHPEYESNGWLYISYAAPGDGGGNTAIMRAKLGGFNLINKKVIFDRLVPAAA